MKAAEHRLNSLDAWELTCVFNMAAASKSLLIGLAMFRGKLSVEEVADELFRGADEGEGGNGDGQLQLSEFAALMAEVKEAETEGGNSDRKHDEL